jgi:hypothetical protein
MRMRMVLIPTWVEEALKAANKPLVTCLDVCELSNTLSKEDVVFYMDLNERLRESLFKPLADTFREYSLYPFTPGQLGGNGIPEPGPVKDFQEYCSRKLIELRLANPKISPYQLVSNSGYEIPPDEQFSVRYTFDVVYLKDDVVGVRPMVRHSDEADINEDIRAYDELMKLLCTFIPFEKIAGLPAFNHYTRLLRSA